MPIQIQANKIRKISHSHLSTEFAMCYSLGRHLQADNEQGGTIARQMLLFLFSIKFIPFIYFSFFVILFSYAIRH